MTSLKKFFVLAAAVLPLMSISAQNEKHGLSRADMDLTVNPGDDFYQYAGGGWMKANPLKPEYSSFGVFNELAEKNRDQLKELFDNLAKEKHAKGSNGQKVTDLYALAMDSVRRNAEGTKPIQQDLADLASFNRATLTEFIAYQHMYLGNPFFGIGVESDLANSAINTMYLSAGSMSLPDRDYYLKTDAESKKIQQKYRDYLTKMFMLAGYKKKDAERATKTIYDIEYKFAEASMTRAEQRDISKLYNPRTIEQLQADYPVINWARYFELMGVKNISTVILEQPKVMAVANNLMTNLKDQEIKDYVAGMIISSASGYLSDEVGETSETLHEHS